MALVKLHCIHVKNEISIENCKRNIKSLETAIEKYKSMLLVSCLTLFPFELKYKLVIFSFYFSWSGYGLYNQKCRIEQ